jgi:transcriptional regulator with XRE-family HTH domain/Zn-dependent peptidase ImmA (M78 family)
MSAMPPERAWEKSEYRTVVEAHLDDELHVGFADGSEAVVPLDRLLPRDAVPAAGDDVRFSASEVVVPTDAGDVEVSWLDVRAQSDSAFREFLVETADEEARRIGQALRALRRRRGLTAKAVAASADIAPMSLSRIERGEHDVVYRTLRRLLAAMNYSLRDLAEASDALSDPTAIAEGLRNAGVPARVIQQLRGALSDRADKIVAAAERIFGWEPAELASGTHLALNRAAAVSGRFKSQVNQNPALATYTLWVHWLAHTVDQGCPRPPAEVPENPQAIRDEILKTHGRVDFTALLAWCWDHHVAVLPLQDPGEFHGACWNFDGRAVIVLKQLTPSASRWAFDLAHELGHVARHIDAHTPAYVELHDLSSSEALADDDEQEANDFAGALLLGNPEELAQELAARTDGRLQRLRRELPPVAEEHNVSAGALANYMAYRLALEGESWWGPAANVQNDETNAPELARQALLEQVDWSLLSPDDAALLATALEWSHG